MSYSPGGHATPSESSLEVRDAPAACGEKFLHRDQVQELPWGVPTLCKRRIEEVAMPVWAWILIIVLLVLLLTGGVYVRR
jgi:hypothetical protein